MRVMPRGKRTVFALFCSESGNRLGTMRFFKQDKLGKSWKDHVEGMQKYCNVCRRRAKVRFKEERHSA